MENTLDLRGTPHILWETGDAFAFDVVDSPYELDAMIRGRTRWALRRGCRRGPAGRGRIPVRTGRWCRTWSWGLDDAVERQAGAGRLAAGITKSDYWAREPGGLEQVGCIYTAQGLEYDYAGVIRGRDLVYRSREGWWVAQPEYLNDGVVRRDVRDGTFLSRVKNTYRVLLTRGLLGCAMYFENEETGDYARSRIDWRRRASK